MDTTRRRHLAALALGLGAGPVLSHGPKPHGGAAPAQAAPEQKPWGIAGRAQAATRTLHIRMGDDMRFTPDRFDVRLGQTLKIVVRNQGRLMHEFVLGTQQELDAHAALMLKFPDMEHDEPWMAHVPPGRSGTLVWTFNRAGEFAFACLMAGHYQAGMIGRVRVIAPAGSAPAQATGA